MPTKPVPDGFHAVTPYLVVKSVSKLIEFLAGAFGAEEIERSVLPNGRTMHAQVRIGDSVVMMGEAIEEGQTTSAALYLYVPDTDAVYRQALAAGAESIMEPEDQFYGDRNAGVRDSSGTTWWLATRFEDVSPEEMTRRMAAQSPT